MCIYVKIRQAATWQLGSQAATWQQQQQQRPGTLRLMLACMIQLIAGSFVLHCRSARPSMRYPRCKKRLLFRAVFTFKIQ
jgi:hypothetical protein